MNRTSLINNFQMQELDTSYGIDGIDRELEMTGS